LLGIFSGEPYVFIEIEALDFGAVKFPCISCLGKMLIKASGCGTGGQTEDTFILIVQGVFYVFNHYVGSDFAHMIEIFGHNYLERHSSAPSMVFNQLSFSWSTSAICLQ